MSQATHTWPADIGAALVTAGAALSLLPKLAVGIGIAYYLIGIWESRTGQRWRKRWRGLFWKMTGEPDVADPLDELRSKLDDIRAYEHDKWMVASIIGMCLVLGGTGFAIAVLVVIYGI